jgi:hypothetical protein
MKEAKCFRNERTYFWGTYTYMYNIAGFWLLIKTIYISFQFKAVMVLKFFMLFNSKVISHENKLFLFLIFKSLKFYSPPLLKIKIISVYEICEDLSTKSSLPSVGELFSIQHVISLSPSRASQHFTTPYHVLLKICIRYSCFNKRMNQLIKTCVRLLWRHLEATEQLIRII